MIDKFLEGGWLTLAVTGSVLVVCFCVRSHYGAVAVRLRKLDRQLVRDVVPSQTGPPVDPTARTAAVLVANYDGLGIHTLLAIPRLFPNQFRNIMFLSVGIVESSDFKEDFSIQSVRVAREQAGARYVALAHSLGLAADFRYEIGTDVVDEAFNLCLRTAEAFPRVIFFAGKIVFERERWFEPILHNQTAFAVERRIQWAGHTMVILPARI